MGMKIQLHRLLVPPDKKSEDQEGGTLCRRKQHKKRLPLQSKHPN